LQQSVLLLTLLAVLHRLLLMRLAGMAVTAIDTPGLHASADAQSANRSLLKSIKAAWKKHKPNFLIYVDRCVGREALALAWFEGAPGMTSKCVYVVAGAARPGWVGHLRRLGPARSNRS
jgi:hypothetical protein